MLEPAKIEKLVSKYLPTRRQDAEQLHRWNSSNYTSKIVK